MKNNWERKKLSDISLKLSLNKIKIKQKDYLSSGLYPIIDQGRELIGGYYNNENLLIPSTPPYIIFGDHTRVKKYVNFQFIPGADGVKVIKAKENIDSKFLFYLLHTIKIEERGYSRHFQLLEKETFLIPNSLDTQHFIVSKIEELFSELDKGVEEIKLAQEQLKVYRQSVLKWAFDGRLTNVNVNEGELPEGWEWNRLDSICEMKAGQFAKANEIESSLKTGFYKCYGGNGLRGYTKTYTHDGNFALVGRQGALCGNVHFAKGKFHATEHAVVVKAKNGINIKWLYNKLVSMRLNQYSTGVAQPGLSVNKLLPIEIAIPTAEKEQQSIVQEIESRFSLADQLEKELENCLFQAVALRQSILKKAFEGELLKE